MAQKGKRPNVFSLNIAVLKIKTNKKYQVFSGQNARKVKTLEIFASEKVDKNDHKDLCDTCLLDLSLLYVTCTRE